VLEIAKAIGREDEVETVFKISEHLAANPERKIKRKSSSNVFEAHYKMV
jgi:glucose-6-phosphate isomerase